MHTDRFLDVDTHLADVQEALHGTDPKWMAIGIQLRIPNAKLSKIRAEPHSNLEDCNRQMQITWLKTGKATWADLVKALRTKTVGLPEVADSIEKMHIHHDKNADHQTVTSEVESPTESKNERLGEIMEWLLKMGFTMEGILKWVSDKGKSQSPSTSGDQATTNQSAIPTRKEKPKTQLQSKTKKRSSPNQTKPPRAKRSRSEGVTPPAIKILIHRSSVDSGTERLKRKIMLDNMMTILQELEKIDEAEEFIDRVGKERAENYDDIIKTPMYLKKMKLKVKQGDYGTPQEFLEDFNLIITNCEEYNGLDSEIMEQANELETEFNKLCSQYLPDDSDYSRLEKMPSDADSSDESNESTYTKDSNSEEEELDQSLSTEIGEDDEDWTPPHNNDD